MRALLLMLLAACTQPDPCAGRFAVGALVWYYGDAPGRVVERDCKLLTYGIALEAGNTVREVGEEDVFAEPTVGSSD